MLQYKPNVKQELFHGFGNANKERLFLAGNRCGKTYCGAMEMAMHLTGNYPDWWQGLRFKKAIKAWAASVTSEATRDILQLAYLGDKSANIVGSISRNSIIKITMRRGVVGAVDTVYVSHKNGGVSSLGFKSYDQGREKFQGTSRDFIHLDEEPDIGIYEECLMRTLDAGGSMILTMTPLKGMTDVCEHFMSGDGENCGKKIVQASWNDAAHLSEAEKTRLRKSLRPHEIEAREKGIPSLGSGKVYPIEESQIAVDRFEIPSHFKRVFGIDFGWTNPTAVVWGAYDVENDLVYIYDVYEGCEKSPAEHSEVIKLRGDWVPGVCDPAGQSSGQGDGISLMERYAEHGIYLNKADNSVESGLMNMLELMQSRRLKVFKDLEPWWKEFRLYRRDEKGRIVKRNDHLMDATRYLIVSGLVMAKSSTKTKALRRVNGWTTI